MQNMNIMNMINDSILAHFTARKTPNPGLPGAPGPARYSNGEGVLLMSVVLTADLKNWKDWRAVGDLMSPLEAMHGAWHVSHVVLGCVDLSGCSFVFLFDLFMCIIDWMGQDGSCCFFSSLQVYSDDFDSLIFVFNSLALICALYLHICL